MPINLHQKASIEGLDYDDLQARLNARTGDQHNDFLSYYWSFQTDKSSCNLNFGPIHQLLIKSDSFRDNIDATLLTIKIYWLEITKTFTSVTSFRQTFNGICLLVNYLVENQQGVLNKQNLQAYFEYSLTHIFKENKPLKLLNIKSYAIHRMSFNFDVIKNSIMARDKSSLLSKDLTAKDFKNSESSALKELSAGELSIRDWKSGNSFNFLTLDFGKYYIEHCALFFEKYFALAKSLYETLQDSEEFVAEAGWPISPDTKTYASYCLLNQEPEDIARERNINIDKVKLLKRLVMDRFQENYVLNQANAFYFTTKAKGIFFDYLAIKNLTESQTDRLGFILENITQGVERDKIRNWVKEIDNPDVTYEKVLQALITLSADMDTDTPTFKANISLSTQLPDIKFYKAMGLEEPTGSGNGYIIQLYKKVMAAGLTDIAASLGWRESEYGFDFGSISVEDNLDFLDQERFPLRFKVNWLVPKTNGSTKINREITYPAYVKITRLKEFIGSKGSMPCLYPTAKSNKKPNRSGASVQRAVPLMWTHFVRHYPPFLILDQIEILESIKAKVADLTCISNKELKQLKSLEKKYTEENWQQFDQDIPLKKTWKRVTDELPIVRFFLMGNETKVKKNWVERYKKRTLPNEYLELLDKHLSDDARAFINEFTSMADATITKQLSAELVSNCIYPTPHALRHMWAESVYRRFDGDVGWMVRSQFKHINPSMWLAYIADKSNESMNELVKLDVINSVVKSFIMKRGDGYSGKLSSYLKRVFRQTNITELHTLEEDLDRFIAAEFISIKSNPWGFCLLKRRNQHLAKCAENGRPIREKAAPKYCLNCSNNLTQETNVDYIYFNIMNDLKLLKTKGIPSAFIQESYNTVKSAYFHIKELAPAHKVLTLMKQVLEERGRYQ